MTLNDLTQSYLWNRYSKRIASKIENPLSCGWFSEEDAQSRGMHLAVGKEGLYEEGNTVCFYLLVDPSDGVIADAKYQVFGHSALMAAAEATATLIVSKSYDQVRRVGVELIDRQLREREEAHAFPEETRGYLNLVLSALDVAIEQCVPIPLPENTLSPVPREIVGKEEGGYPDWISLSKKEKVAVIEKVIEEEIRPYIELDAGGIEVQDLTPDQELIISYQGACTSCFSAIGATLSTIQQIIATKVHPSITVVPNMDDLEIS